jgi:hypothetical protein
MLHSKLRKWILYLLIYAIELIRLPSRHQDRAIPARLLDLDFVVSASQPAQHASLTANELFDVGVLAKVMYR